MTDTIEDPRVIDAEAPQYNATLVRREDMTDSLATFWVRFDGEPTPFEAGQYMTIGVMVDGRMVQRPVLGRVGRRRWPARTATSSTSGSSRAARSRRCCGACRSGTACG